MRDETQLHAAVVGLVAVGETLQTNYVTVVNWDRDDQTLHATRLAEDIRREETEGLKKKIRIDLVAANVPDLDDENGILRRQLQAFRERLQHWVYTIHRYESLHLLEQSIFTLERPDSKLAKSYRGLLKVLSYGTPLQEPDRRLAAEEKAQEERLRKAQDGLRKTRDELRQVQDEFLQKMREMRRRGVELSPDWLTFEEEILAKRRLDSPDLHVRQPETDQSAGV